MINFLSQKRKEFINFPDWKGFKAFLVKTFGDNMLPETALTKLMRLKLSATDTIIEHNEKFTELLRKSGISDEKRLFDVI